MKKWIKINDLELIVASKICIIRNMYAYGHEKLWEMGERKEDSLGMKVSGRIVPWDS